MNGVSSKLARIFTVLNFFLFFRKYFCVLLAVLLGRHFVFHDSSRLLHAHSRRNHSALERREQSDAGIPRCDSDPIFNHLCVDLGFILRTGLAFRPMPDMESNLVRFIQGKPETYKQYTDHIQAFLWRA